MPPARAAGATGGSAPAQDNPLWNQFAGHVQGHGLYKWTHYLEIYHRHFARFVGQPVHLAEVGVLGGGSLELWRNYLGEQSHLYGIDIQPECAKFATERISIFIGDQQDRTFWANFRGQVPMLDILIDDGGHQPEQQMVTLEEMLPHLQPGGVYICEDILGIQNSFATFAAGLIASLNQACPVRWGQMRCPATPFQQAVHSLHWYPYMLVIEKHPVPPAALVAVTRGTEWPAFLRLPKLA